jgi:hypothetical protein
VTPMAGLAQPAPPPFEVTRPTADFGGTVPEESHD